MQHRVVLLMQAEGSIGELHVMVESALGRVFHLAVEWNESRSFIASFGPVRRELGNAELLLA